MFSKRGCDSVGGSSATFHAVDGRFSLFRFVFLSVALSLGSCAVFDFSSPQVISCFPLDQQKGVSPDVTIQITFSEPMNKKQTELSFSISGQDSVVGTFYWRGNTLYFKPSRPLKRTHWYTVSLRGAEDLHGNDLPDFSFRFLVGYEDEPQVVEFSPSHGSMGNPTDVDVVVEFSVPMDKYSVQRAFSITPEVSGLFYWDSSSKCMRFHPVNDLSWGQKYTVTVSKDARSQRGRELFEELYFSFWVGYPEDSPEVEAVYQNSTSPWVSGILNHGVSRWLPVYIRFDRAMDPVETIDGISLSPSVQIVPTWEAGDSILRLDFPDMLSPNGTYILTISSSCKDARGGQLRSTYTYSFIVDASDSLPPYVDRVASFYNETDVAPIDPWIQNQPISFDANGDYKNVTVHFYENGVPVSMNTASVVSRLSVAYISGSGGGGVEISDIRWESESGVPDSVLVIDLAGLRSDNYYRLSIDGGFEDARGNPSSRDFNIFFTTE